MQVELVIDREAVEIQPEDGTVARGDAFGDEVRVQVGAMGDDEDAAGHGMREWTIRRTFVSPSRFAPNALVRRRARWP